MDVSEVTQEQLDALETKVEVLERGKDESVTKMAEYETAKADLEAKNKELESQINPNWQKARQTIDALKEIAKSKGVELNEDGTVKSNPQNVDVSKLLADAALAGAQAAKNEILGGRVEELLSGYDIESSKLVRHFYDKLTVGETVTLQNVNKFMNQAVEATRVELGGKINKATTFSGGQGPRLPNENKPLDDQTANDLGSKMGLSFATVPKK